MKIYELTFKEKTRITIDGIKQEIKKWFKKICLTLDELKTFLPYCTAKVITVNDSKFISLIEKNLKNLDWDIEDFWNFWNEKDKNKIEAVNEEINRRKWIFIENILENAKNEKYSKKDLEKLEKDLQKLELEELKEYNLSSLDITDTWDDTWELPPEWDPFEDDK